MTATKIRKINSATVWIITQRGMEMDGRTPADHRERLLDIFERGIPRKPECEADYLACTPVEINIRLSDVARAVAKWIKVCGNDPARVIAVRQHKPAYDRFNTVYDD